MTKGLTPKAVSEALAVGGVVGPYANLGWLRLVPNRLAVELEVDTTLPLLSAGSMSKNDMVGGDVKGG